MFKSNGRLSPASKIEMASIEKGKNMYCPTCKKYNIIINVEFANTKCGYCGKQLIDSDISTANGSIEK